MGRRKKTARMRFIEETHIMRVTRWLSLGCLALVMAEPFAAPAASTAAAAVAEPPSLMLFATTIAVALAVRPGTGVLHGLTSLNRW
jgi:hypothetical protein